MQLLAEEVWRLRPEHVDVTVGELAYHGALAREDREDRSLRRLWTHGSRPAAWGWFFPPGALEWQVHPDHPELLEEVLDWFESVAGAESVLSTQVRTSDADAEERLRRRGFEHDATAPWMRLNIRDLDQIEQPEVPLGYRFRTVREYGDDISRRVDIHRSSWAEFGTRVTEASYRGVMGTWPYRSELDFVLEDPARKPVAFALGWYDERNRLAEFEPVGTDPAARRRGLARALTLFGMHRFRKAGATRVIVACRGDSAHTAPARLYESVGFRELSRQRPLIRR